MSAEQVQDPEVENSVTVCALGRGDTYHGASINVQVVPYLNTAYCTFKIAFIAIVLIRMIREMFCGSCTCPLTKSKIKKGKTDMREDEQGQTSLVLEKNS